MWVRGVVWWTMWALLWAPGAGGQEEDARLERLYEKLERLNALDSEAAAAESAEAREQDAERTERQLEMVAALAVSAPRLGAEQLEELLTDLRDASADYSPYLMADVDGGGGGGGGGGGAEYAEEDWHGEDDYPMDDEEAEGEEETWTSVGGGGGGVTAEPPLEGDAEAEEDRLRSAALLHWKRVMRGAGCGEPAARVLCAQDVHPHAGKIYLPQCAVLHRCGRDTGCCHDAALQCAPLPRYIRVVYLPFYVLTVESSTNSQERLPFLNHTRCGCLNRTAALAAEAAAAAALDRAEAAASSLVAAPVRIRIADTAQAAAATAGAAGGGNGGGGGGGGGGMARDDDSTRRPHSQRAAPPPPQQASTELVTREPTNLTQRCICPREFTPSWSTRVGVGTEAGTEAREEAEEGSCACECRDRDCARLAKGKEHFGLRDRLCIKRGQCAAPSCEFGLYNRATGRCPRRRDPPASPLSHPPLHRFISRLL